MPLIKSGSEEAFWKNYKELLSKFKGEGLSEEEAKKRALAAAARMARDQGGNPDKWLGSKKS